MRLGVNDVLGKGENVCRALLLIRRVVIVRGKVAVGIAASNVSFNNLMTSKRLERRTLGKKAKCHTLR